jgi:hypothetical protein
VRKIRGYNIGVHKFSGHFEPYVFPFGPPSVCFLYTLSFFPLHFSNYPYRLHVQMLAISIITPI